MLFAFHDGPPTPVPAGLMVRWLTDPFGFYRELLRGLDGSVGLVAHAGLGILASGAMAFLIVLVLRRLRERRLASGARLLQILPLPEVDTDGAIALWMALHALIRPRLKRLLLGQPHLVWELAADGGDAALSV